jgi:flagellar biosynthesis GTPase FlhF
MEPAQQTPDNVAQIFTADDAAVPPVAQGGAIAPPDLSAQELLPAVGGAAVDTDKRKSTYALLKVQGASLPSASSKFVGTTPKAAMMKAARRIHKRSGTTEFTVIMRRVSSRKVDKKLYKYAVVMKKRSRPTGFVTLTDPRFVVEKTTVKKGVTTKTKGDVSINIDKKVPIVQTSDHPVYGFINESGELEKGQNADAKFVVVRPAGTDTLYLVVPGPIPDSINGKEVVKTDWDVATIEDSPISDAEREEYDIASRAKDANDSTAKAKSDALKKAAEKKREGEREAKLKAKAAKAVQREKDRLKREAAKAKADEKKAKDRARKEAAKAKAAAKAAAKKK